ncbi:MAG: hypothetical protein IV100_15140 [Myxococcales bacterium]|nr:hypothetical protein [Myxococcales bacterium]
MPIPTQLTLNAALGGTTRTDASGSVDITALADRTRYSIGVACSGASASFTLDVSFDGTNWFEKAGAATPDSAGAVLAGDDGPFPYARVSWTGNTHVVRIDAQVRD